MIASHSGSEIDTQPELVLELDEAAELTQLLDVLVAAERGEHACEITLRSNGRAKSLAERLANRGPAEVVVAARAGRDRNYAQLAVRPR